MPRNYAPSVTVCVCDEFAFRTDGVADAVDARARLQCVSRMCQRRNVRIGTEQTDSPFSTVQIVRTPAAQPPDARACFPPTITSSRVCCEHILASPLRGERASGGDKLNSLSVLDSQEGDGRSRRTFILSPHLTTD